LVAPSESGGLALGDSGSVIEAIVADRALGVGCIVPGRERWHSVARRA